MGVPLRILFLWLTMAGVLTGIAIYNKDISDSRTITEPSVYRNKVGETKAGIDNPGADCEPLFAGDEAAVKAAQNNTSSRLVPDAAFLALTRDCDAFIKRGYLMSPVNAEEENFPLAFSLQIYKDVIQVERLLRAIYRPQNIYCVNVDGSSPLEVHQAVQAIANCFNNIVVTQVDVEWGEFSVVQADLVCMQELFMNNTNWKYLMTLTGQEFPLKTNLDIVRILHSLNGSNAIYASKQLLWPARWRSRPSPPGDITLVKGSCHFAVTRSFVDFVLHDERALEFRKWVKRTKVPDELFFQSLSHSPQLGVPGAYTGLLESADSGYSPIMRYKIWRNSNLTCQGVYRRAVCVLGVGDLQYLSTSDRLFANKLYYDYQPITLQCLEQRHYNWTRQDILGQATDRINLTFYTTLPNVRQHIPSGLEHWK